MPLPPDQTNRHPIKLWWTAAKHDVAVDVRYAPKRLLRDSGACDVKKMGAYLDWVTRYERSALAKSDPNDEQILFSGSHPTDARS